jgi:hypothetical protein
MFDSSHPPSFFEPLIDSEHAAALIQVHPKTLQRYARKGIVSGLRVGNCGASALPNLWLAALERIT